MISIMISYALDSFAELGRLAREMFFPCGLSHTEYAQRCEIKKCTYEIFRGLTERIRARLYRLRHIPCQHKASGTMIKKKGRLVRRKV